MDPTFENVLANYIDKNGVASTIEALRQALYEKFLDADASHDDLAKDYFRASQKVEKIALVFNYL